jgi:hypothetical protein
VSYPPQGPYPPQQHPAVAYQPPKPKRSPWLYVGLGVAGVLALCMGVGVIGSLSDPESGATTGGRTAATATAKAAANDKPATKPQSNSTPEPAQFRLTAKVTKKDCFGSAGCNITFRPDVTYTGPALDPDDTWTVVYEIRGVEDEPEVSHLEMTGTQFEADDEDVSTTSSHSKITLKVTSVEAAD